MKGGSKNNECLNNIIVKRLFEKIETIPDPNIRNDIKEQVKKNICEKVDDIKQDITQKAAATAISFVPVIGPLVNLFVKTYFILDKIDNKIKDITDKKFSLSDVVTSGGITQAESIKKNTSKKKISKEKLNNMLLPLYILTQNGDNEPLEFIKTKKIKIPRLPRQCIKELLKSLKLISKVENEFENEFENELKNLQPPLPRGP